MLNFLKFIRNIRHLLVIAICLPLLFCAYYQFQIRQSSQSAELILDKIDHTLTENQELLKFIGERIMIPDKVDLKYINSLLKGTNVLSLSHLMGAYICWADKKGTMLVSGKKGILTSDYPSISHRKYYKEGLKEPWKLHISPVEQSVFSTNYVVPTSMSIANSSGEVMGFLVLGLRLKFLERIMTESLKALEWQLVYPDHNSIFGSVGFPKNFNWSDKSYANGGTFVVKSKGNFALKVAVGMPTINLLTNFLKLYFIFILTYLVASYCFIRVIMPQMKNYWIKEDAAFSDSLLLALSSEDKAKINSLNLLLPTASSNSRIVIEFLINMIGQNAKLTEAIDALTSSYHKLLDSVRMENKYITNMGILTQSYLNSLKGDLKNIIDDNSYENKLTINKMINSIEQIESGSLSNNEKNYCNLEEPINKALAINAHNIHVKDIQIDCVIDDLPELYIDSMKLESAVIALTRYCIDNSLRSKEIKIRAKNILNDKSSIVQLTFEVHMVAMNTFEKAALDHLLNGSTKFNIFNPLSKTYEQIEKIFKEISASIYMREFAEGGMKITISLNVNQADTASPNLSNKDNVISLKRVQ